MTFSRYFLCCAWSKSSPDVADVFDLEALLERRRLGVRRLLDVDREHGAIVYEYRIGKSMKQNELCLMFFFFFISLFVNSNGQNYPVLVIMRAVQDIYR